MKEVQLHEILIANPFLIEEGCTFVESEVNLNGKRCDLLFLDNKQRKLYVEVKLVVNDRAVGQLIRYEGLANNPEARYMLVGLSFVEGLKEGLEKHGFEYKEIDLDNTKISKENITIFQKKILRNKSNYETIDQLINKYSPNDKNIALEIYQYVNEFKDIYYYISDGIMFRRAGRKYKFLSLTTKNDRVLFHFPIKMRDKIFDKYKEKINIYIPIDPRDKNQIDIYLKDINKLEDIIELINLAYIERE